MPRGESERTLDELLAHLDVGSKEMRDGKLYLAQENDTVMGAVPFTIEGTIITSPDGTQFDLADMKYMGDDGLYSYLTRMAGTEGVNPWEGGGQA